MQSIRRSSSLFIVSVLAVLAGSGTAFAGAAPLIEPDPSTRTHSTTSSPSGFFDGWLLVGLALVIAVAVVAAAVAVVSRARQHSPSHA